MTKLAKKYITEARKTVSSSQWQAKGLTKAWKLQKAAKGGGSRAKSKALTKSNPKPVANNKKYRPKGGATYQAVKVTVQAAMPLTDYVLTPGAKSVDGLGAHLKARANIALAKGYAVAAADYGLSKSRFVQHAAGLSRLSVTALAPEAYLALKTYEDVRDKRTARGIHNELALATTGYRPVTGTWGAGDRTRFYHKLKWGGALVRLIANRTRFGRAITRPIRENILRELGGAV